MDHIDRPARCKGRDLFIIDPRDPNRFMCRSVGRPGCFAYEFFDRGRSIECKVAWINHWINEDFAPPDNQRVFIKLV